MNDPNAKIGLREECFRKGLHLVSLWIPIGYVLLPGKQILIPLGTILSAAVAVEIIRTLSPSFERFFEKRLGTLLRPRERQNVTGATTLFLSAFLAVVFFEKWVALYVLLLMLVSDALGALVGRLIGRRFYRVGRTLEGTLAFFFSGFLLMWMVPGVRPGIALVGLVVALILETGVIKFDDNLIVPLGSGVVMELLSWIMHPMR